MAPINPSLVGDEIPAQGEDIKDTSVIGVWLKVDGKVLRPSLEVSRGEGQDLLQQLLVDVEVEHPTP